MRRRKLQALTTGYAEMMKVFRDTLPCFPDGRIDYTFSVVAPVINCVVTFDSEVLLLQRSLHVAHHGGKWGGVTGFIDTDLPPRQIALKEVREEIGVESADSLAIREFDPYLFQDDEAGKLWIVYPIVFAVASRPRITLTWENSDYRWVDRSAIACFDLLPGQDRMWVEVFG